jgi:type I restriction enzyme M protein
MRNGVQNGKATNGKSKTDVLNTAGLIWSVADEVLRGPFKPHQYGSVILPFTVMRRLDCVLEPTKEKVLAAVEEHQKKKVDLGFLVGKIKGPDGKPLSFWNSSQYTFNLLMKDAPGIKANLIDYVGGFSDNIRDIFDNYKVIPLIDTLADGNLLFKLIQKFAAVNLHPDVVPNTEMGRLFEELIRKFSEDQNESPGEHYTPRDAIKLMVELLFATDEDPNLGAEQRVVTLYDPTAGTGGMLSVAEEHLKEQNSALIVRPFGQELNPETYAICKADMLIKGQDVSKIVLGNTLSKDAFPNQKFDYMLSNPPYGYDWKAAEDEVREEHKKFGFKGRFGPGLPRISDGQMLFLLTLVSKMHPKGGETSRIAIVMNGSPLFTGGAGSGESEIRRYLIENDLVEAIVGLPSQMFYNTGISTYVWILSSNKEKRRKGNIQLIDASNSFEKMRKPLGDKRRYLSDSNIAEIVKTYGAFLASTTSKILPNEAFGYYTITVERPLRLNFQVTPERLERLAEKKALVLNGIDLPKLKTVLTGISSQTIFKNRSAFTKALTSTLRKAGIALKPLQQKAILEAVSERDESADICVDGKGKPEPDADLRDTENDTLGENIRAYFEREVLSDLEDAWIDETKTVVGYEVPFTREFYKYVPPRTISEIDADLQGITAEILADLRGASA